MALDPRIILAGQQVTPTDPNEEAVRAGQASDALALARQRIQASQDDASFKTAMQQAGGDPDKAITLLQSTNPRAALTYGAMITKQRQDNLKLAADQSDFLGKQTDAALKLFQGVGNDPKQYQIALRGAFGILHDTPAGDQLAALPQNPTPDEIPGLVDSILQKGMSAKDYHEQITSGLKTWLGGDPVAGLAHMLEVTDDPQMRQSIIQSAKTHGAPDAFVAAATSLSNQVAAGADPKTFRKLLGDQKPLLVGPDTTVVDPSTMTPMFKAPPKPMTPYEAASLDERTKHDRAMENKPAASANPEAQADKGYNSAKTRLDALRKPIDDTADKFAGLVDMVNQKTPQADALIAPKLLSVTVGGTGSGLRMTQSEIDRAVGGRSNWESLKAALNKWEADPSKALSVTDSQRAQIRQLIAAVGDKANAKIQAIQKADADLLDAKSVDEQRRIIAGVQKQVEDITSGGASQTSAGPMTPHAVPVPKNPVKGQIWQSPTGPVTWNGSRWVSGG